MDYLRRWLLLVPALLLVEARAEGGWQDNQEQSLAQKDGYNEAWCAQLCPPSQRLAEPSAPRCPDCRPPQCPAPVCPTPVCPPLPPIPPPIVNLACPQPKCSQLSTQPSSVENQMLRAFHGNKLYKTKVSWIEANETCFRAGAHLAIPKSQAEQFALMGIMNLNDEDKIHVGFNDNIKEGHYTSVLGKPMDPTQLRMWDRNQPSGGRRENCAVMYNYGKMHDWPCSTAKFAFVCEIPH